MISIENALKEVLIISLARAGVGTTGWHFCGMNSCFHYNDNEKKNEELKKNML